MARRYTRKNHHVKAVLIGAFLLIATIASVALSSADLDFVNRAKVRADVLTDPHLGPGELSDIKIITTNVVFNWTQYSYTTTFTITGDRVTPYPSLNARYFHHTRDNYDRPVVNTINFSLTKSNNIFTGTVTLYGSGCVDVNSNTNSYLASFCVGNSSIGYSAVAGMMGPDTSVPFRYSGGRYIWDQNHQQMYVSQYRFTGYIPGVENNKFAAQSLTLGFNKNVTPYWTTNNPDNDFKPTNIYWKLQNTLNLSQIVEIRYALRPNSRVACANQTARMGIFNTIEPDPNPTYFDVTASLDCWFMNEYPYSPGPFPTTKYLSLVPAELPTATPEPPTSTPAPFTPTPTPEPPITACEADLSNNGIVDQDDVDILRNYFGKDCTQGGCEADFNDDGLVDIMDFGLLRSVYNQKCDE